MAAKTILISVLLLVILHKVTVEATSSTKALFPVGGLFNDETLKYSRQAFETIGIARGSSNSKAYNGRIIYPSVRDSYSVALEVCQNTSDGNGIVALVDARPTDGICDTVCLLCNRNNISHLTIGWEPTETMSQDLFTFSFYPPPEIISKAFATLIRDLGWDKFTIMYEDDSSFVRLPEIIGSWPHTKEPIRYRKLDPDGDNRETFKEIFKVSRMTHHVMDCDTKNLLKYMSEILQVENSTQYQSFILTNLDSHTVDLRAVPNLVANVSTMYMTTTDPTRWKDIGIDPGSGIKMETALAVDALNHLEKAIRKMQMDEESGGEDGFAIPKPDYGTPPQLCFKSSKAEYEPWEWGDKLRQALLEVVTKGFTGNIKFDSEGKRTDFEMHYFKLNNESQFIHAGAWDSTTNIITKEQTVPDRSMMQTSGVIRVLSKKDLPYFDFKIDEDGKTIPRGYAVDLVTEIFNIINTEQGTQFTLKFWEVPDKQYGSPIEGTKMWNGIIGELMQHKADLAVCDISITSERNAVVDFSTPFMSTGISMLFRERDPVDPDMFSFINPLSLDVWLYLATTYIIVSFILLICARMSQDDWVNPHPCNQNPESLQNIWSLYNCMWLTMGSIMTQGCDILPRGLGSRWTTGIWYFFAMIVTASYTANMSTFLSNSRRSNDITDVKQLSEQNKVSYGAVYNASTYKFFQNSNDTVYQKIWQVMSTTKPTVFTHSNDEGKERVLRSKGNYAFFMESTAIKYYTERDCMLRMVGPPLDSKAYGIAMPKNFPHKGLVDRAILSLQESGRLAQLANKWWKEEDNENKCEKMEEEDDSGSLQMKNTSGIFLVLGVGGILGLIVAIIDFLMHARKIAVRERVSFKEAVASEWRASLNPRTLAKPAAPPRSAPPSSGSPSPLRERSRSRAVSILHAASSFINFDDIH